MWLGGALFAVLVCVAPLVASSCPADCRCVHSRTRAAADCSSSSLDSVPASLEADTSIIDLSYNRFTTLHNNTFRQLAPSVQKLVFTDNTIAEVEPGAFDGVLQLWWLSLENNVLRRVHPHTFSGAPKLWKLILSGNPLYFPVDGSPFLIAPELRILELSRCGIATLPPATFRNLTGLWTLRLKENRLSALDAIRDLPELEVLDLHGNEIASLHPDVFATVPKLKQLNVSSNPLLVPLDGPFLNAPLLFFLDLSLTNVTRLGRDVFSGVQSLRVIRISATRLHWIDAEAFSNLSRLERASLDGNAITTLDAGAFAGNEQLLELDLSGNGLQVRADARVLESAALTTLDLRGSRLPVLGEDTLSGLPALSVLDAGRCGVAELSPAAFHGLADLYELRLPHNRLTALPAGVFRRCHRLAEVNLRGNNLRQLSEFPAAPALERLDLGECAMEGSLPVLDGVPWLRRLLVDGNRLTTADGDSLAGSLPALRRLALQGNPWRCDCALRSLWRWCHADSRARGHAVQALGRRVDTGEDASRCPDDVMCGDGQRQHWDSLEMLQCEGDAESTAAAAGHDPNLDVEMLDPPGRLRAP